MQNPPKEITTLAYTLIPTGGGADAVLSYEDLDGENGANPPSYIIEPLKANTSYSGTIVILNKRVSPATNITSELLAEAEDYQLFYETEGGANATFTYTDQDNDGNPIGIMTTLSTGSPGSGKINIRLVYQPEKDATGVASGDITNANGRTDKVVSFDVLIQ
ncbi:type 1 periplasmic binding fold superfamily protein [Okeania hirsuta]|uniref:type 1 periplasmic binding fold superfamily protein n=1 Tax=Okeania hirsuta TaxID=1458930 RepID=UPI000F5478B0|nr:type 1 periplasmic binding fold superfamily protein [Okeania hirsuta]